MKYDIFVTCQFAADYSGSLCITGASDVFRAKQVAGKMVGSGPEHYRVSNLFIVFRLQFDSTEHGLHTFQLSFVDSIGTAIVPTIKDGFDLRKVEKSPGFGVTKIINMNGVPIPKLGDYRITLELDDTPLIERTVTFVPER